MAHAAISSTRVMPPLVQPNHDHGDSSRVQLDIPLAVAQCQRAATLQTNRPVCCTARGSCAGAQALYSLLTDMVVPVSLGSPHSLRAPCLHDLCAFFASLAGNKEICPLWQEAGFVKPFVVVVTTFCHVSQHLSLTRAFGAPTALPRTHRGKDGLLEQWNNNKSGCC